MALYVSQPKSKMLPLRILWGNDPRILYESLANLRNRVDAHDLTLRFKVIRDCAFKNLTHDLCYIIASMGEEVWRRLKIRIHLKVGICTSGRSVVFVASMSWRHSCLVVLLDKLWRKFKLKVECRYKGCNITEADIRSEVNDFNRLTMRSEVNDFNRLTMRSSFHMPLGKLAWYTKVQYVSRGIGVNFS